MSAGSPEPGWYDDPHLPGLLRWWDGTQWTDHRRPRDAAGEGGVDAGGPSGSTSGPVGRSHGLPELGELISRTFSLLWRQSGQLVAALLVLVVAPAAFLGWAVWNAVDGLALIDDEFVGWDSGALAPLVAATVVFGVAQAVFGQVAVHQVIRADAERPVWWSASLAPALRSVGRLFLWALPLIAAGIVVMVVFLVVAVAVPLLLILLIPALVVALVWIGVRLSFMPQAALGTPQGTNLIQASWSLTAGRFWPLFGRLLIIGLIASAVGFVMSIVTTPLGAGFDFTEVEVESDGSVDDIVFADVIGGAGWAAVAVLVVWSVVQAIQTAVSSSGGAVLYHRAGGDVSRVLDSDSPTDPDRPTDPVITNPPGG